VTDAGVRLVSTAREGGSWGSEGALAVTLPEPAASAQSARLICRLAFHTGYYTLKTDMGAEPNLNLDP
jgi:hypothetical protein